MCRKGEMLPTCPHTKNPQAVDNLWIIWARYVYLSIPGILLINLYAYWKGSLSSRHPNCIRLVSSFGFTLYTVGLGNFRLDITVCS